jgi:DNA-binding transcriptional MerR regulator/methylmalonyl-CoA mutase cobalamin-binding subunit
MEPEMPQFREKRHPIQVAARRTRLTQEVLRVWEKRYGAVTPGRTPTGRRLYSDADIERLQMLRQATLAGRRIGAVANLTRGQLVELIEEDRRAESQPLAQQAVAPAAQDTSNLLDACLKAVMALDAGRLEAVLRRAFIALSSATFIDSLIAPLVQAVGSLWAEDRIAPDHEHMATAVIRQLIGEMLLAAAPADAPLLVATTPAGQRHEIGALLAAAAALGEGWRVLYLGPDLPAADIAHAVKESRASAVALSIVYPGDDPKLAAELKDLRGRLPEPVQIFAGGAAAPAYADALRRIGASLLPDLRAFREALAKL